MLLEAKAITKRYGNNIVLDDISFAIPEGGVTGLIGPNGSGKTTLFEVLAGMIPADTGEVRFRAEPLPLKNRKTALFYLPDGIRPWAGQPVGWLLRFFAGLYGAAESDVRLLTELLRLQMRTRGMQSGVEAAEAFRAHQAFKRARAW